MPFRPSGYVGWCSTGATNVTEPTDTKKAYGWAVNEQPPSSYFNWIHQKQDQWIQYLAWRGAMDLAIFDDFVYPTGFAAPAGRTPSGFGWKWSYDVGGATANNFVNWATGGAQGGVNPVYPQLPGFITLEAGASGPVPLVQRIQIGSRDFRMEIVGYIDNAGNTSNASGCRAEFGFPNFCAFRSTGMSAFALQIVPSGMSLGNATLIAMTAGPSCYAAASGLAVSKWVLERQGATMSVEVNDARVMYLPSTVFGASGQDMDFGARLHGAQTAQGPVRAVVDKLALWLGRNPV